MEKAVGVIGLGAMGLPIAIRLARAGFRLVAIDVDWWPAPRARQAAGSPCTFVWTNWLAPAGEVC
jgi:3-hydroxyisobutyrate dehydrogenase-like beta-hydroxyacid dehydrogenase